MSRPGAPPPIPPHLRTGTLGASREEQAFFGEDQLGGDDSEVHPGENEEVHDTVRGGSSISEFPTEQQLAEPESLPTLVGPSGRQSASPNAYSPFAPKQEAQDFYGHLGQAQPRRDLRVIFSFLGTMAGGVVVLLVLLRFLSAPQPAPIEKSQPKAPEPIAPPLPTAPPAAALPNEQELQNRVRAEALLGALQRRQLATALALYEAFPKDSPDRAKVDQLGQRLRESYVTQALSQDPASHSIRFCEELSRVFAAVPDVNPEAGLSTLLLSRCQENKARSTPVSDPGGSPAVQMAKSPEPRGPKSPPKQVERPKTPTSPRIHNVNELRNPFQ